MVFAGTVIKVEHFSSTNAPGVTKVSFRVETAIRGTRRGQILKINEWEGLWNSGERYQVGERVLLFLYPKSRLGLTSPVGGALGRYRFDDAGRVLMQGTTGRPRPVRLQDLAAAVRRAARE
jgi:hypothetical protein